MFKDSESKGIKINNNKYKITQFADDTTLILYLYSFKLVIVSRFIANISEQKMKMYEDNGSHCLQPQ